MCSKFGKVSVHPEQLQAVLALFVGRDVLAILPTGFGKTLIAFALVFLFDVLLNGPPNCRLPSARCFFPVVIMLSPLIALMTEQADTFNAFNLGIMAVALIQEQQDPLVLLRVQAGFYGLLLMSPESALERFLWIFTSSKYRANRCGVC
jgi:superfamily II DNA helicase RecQ